MSTAISKPYAQGVDSLFRQLVVWTFPIQVALAVLCTVWGLAEPRVWFSAVGLSLLAMVCVPVLLDRSYEFFSPWTFVLLSVLVGMTLRGIYISLGLPSTDVIDSLYLLGEPIEHFYYGWVVALAGVASMVCGYLCVPRRNPRAVTSLRWQRARIIPVTAGVLLLSCWATWSYVSLTGGLGWAQISAKRATITDIDISNDEEYRGYGLLRELGEFAFLGHLLVMGFRRTNHSSESLWLAVLQPLLFALACLLPFYSSTRGTIVLFAGSSIAASHYLGKPLRIGRLAVAAILVLFFFHAMTILRASQGKVTLDEYESHSIADVIGSLIVNRNLMGIAKTCHIVKAVPDLLEPAYGETIYVWLVAPIPRGVWPAKPLIHSGPIIGNAIYGTRVSGVPPGLIGELYWNFQLPGVLIGCFGFGALLRWVFQHYAPRHRTDDHRVLLYTAGPMWLGFHVLGTSLGAGLARIALSLLCMHLLLIFATRRQERTVNVARPRLRSVSRTSGSVLSLTPARSANRTNVSDAAGSAP